MPDMDEYVSQMATVGRFAEKYGLGLELSLLSPLEVGPAYVKTTGESGTWMQYRKGVRDPVTGAFSVQMWRQLRWTNNKGPVDVAPARVRAFAFQERPVPGTPYRGWIRFDRRDQGRRRGGGLRQPGSPQRRFPGTADPHSRQGRRAASGTRSRAGGAGYRTPEIDYFSARALPFLEALVDKYLAAGIKLNGNYSDEMHIQGDWVYFGHHDNGEFCGTVRERRPRPPLCRTLWR